MRLITLYTLLSVIAICPLGCYTHREERVKLQEGVGSSTPIDNVVTQQIAHAFSAIIGQGIEIRNAVTRINKDGFLELEVSGFNEAYDTRRFEYKVEWLDASGMVIDTTTSRWMQTSAMPKSPFTIKAVAPRTSAVNFRMNTRKIPN
jgi:uncharacterized protein YcfL